MTIRATRRVPNNDHPPRQHAVADDSLFTVLLAAVLYLKGNALKHRLGIREVQVQRDEYPIFHGTSRQKIWINGTCEIFGDRGFDIMAETVQRGLNPSRQVLVKLEAQGHSATLSRMQSLGMQLERTDQPRQ